MENNNVTISLEKYEHLIAIETRCNVLANYTIYSKYSIEREMIANIFGFELPAEENNRE